MSNFIVIIAIVCIIGIYTATHLRPLSEKQISKLASKKRRRRIRRYFTFDTSEFVANKEFKRKMNPNGSFYNLNEKLFEFPSIAASLLKYKKHEWIIIAFEKDETIERVWINKGFDRESVGSFLSTSEIVQIGKENKMTSIFIFHNHPNSNPAVYSCKNPSLQDLKSAKEYASELNNNGINLVEFICERGSHYEYFLSPSEQFLPVQEIVKAIELKNGISKRSNLKLHLQRLF